MTVSNRRQAVHSAGETVMRDRIDLIAADADIGKLPIGEIFQPGAGA